MGYLPCFNSSRAPELSKRKPSLPSASPLPCISFIPWLITPWSVVFYVRLRSQLSIRRVTHFQLERAAIDDIRVTEPDLLQGLAV